MKELLLKIFKHKNISSLIASVLYSLLILPINESLAFQTNGISHKSIVVSHILKMGFSIFIFFVVRFGLIFFEKILQKDKIYLKWIKYSLIYLAVLVILLVLIYPGHWVWDEFFILDAVKEYSLYSWQNYFTNIYYTFCLYIFPSGISIVVLQTVFCSFVFGYCTSQISKVFKNKYLKIALFILFLMPPVLINDLYPLRLTPYSYIELILITKLIILYKNNIVNNKFTELFKYSILITLLCFWRSEGIFYLVLIPVLLIKLGIINKKTISKKTILYIIPSLFVLITGFAITKYTSDEKYILASIVNPLSIMLQDNLSGSNLKQELKDMDKTLDLKLIRENPSYIEVPSFWNGAVREGYKTSVNQTIKSFVMLVINNPWSFIKARVKTFLATNSLDYSAPMSTSPLMFKNNSEPVSDRINLFYETNYLARPISVDLKYNVTKALLMLNDKYQVSIIGKFIWSIIPISILLIPLLVVSFIKKHKIFSLLISFMILRIAILFLTAPAHYFMYYLPIYIGGSFIAFVYISKLIDNKDNEKK